MSKPIEKILKAKTELDRNNMSNVIIQSFINKPVKTTAWEDLRRNQDFLKGMVMELSTYIYDEPFPIEKWNVCNCDTNFIKGEYFMYALLLAYGLI